MVTSQVSFSAFASACALASVQTARTGVPALPIQQPSRISEQGIPALSLPGDAVEVSTPPVESSPLPSLDAGPVPRSSVGGGECPVDRWRRRAVLLCQRFERMPFGVLVHTSYGPRLWRFSSRARAWNCACRVGGLFVEV